MTRTAIYWIITFCALAFCLIYNLIISEKFGIKRWKLFVITFIAFAYNWGVSYITAFIEAGLQPAPSVNGVRAWVYVPLYFIATSMVFRIDFKRLSDAITACFIIGFSVGKFACTVPGCCYGYPYEGFGAVFSHSAGYNVFPIQYVEASSALLLFIAFVIYSYKSNFKITGRQYPVMLLFYMARILFEFFRDNEKIIGNISSLAFHSLFGGIVGGIWLFFTTARGKVVVAKINNVLRKLIGKNPIPVLSKEEYKQQILETQQALRYPQKIDFASDQIMQIKDIDEEDFHKKTKKTIILLSGCIIVSLIIFIFCILYFILLPPVRMATILVSIFTVFSLFILIYSAVMLLQFYKNLKTAKETPIIPVIFNKPDEDTIWMLYRKKAYTVHFADCPTCQKKLRFSKANTKYITTTCIGKEKHMHRIPQKSLFIIE